LQARPETCVYTGCPELPKKARRWAGLSGLLSQSPRWASGGLQRLRAQKAHIGASTGLQQRYGRTIGPYLYVVPEIGIEPTTYALRMRRSTN